MEVVRGDVAAVAAPVDVIVELAGNRHPLFDQAQGGQREERGEGAEDAEYAIGAFRFQPARKRLVATTTGARIRLTDKETAILRHLHRAVGQVVPRDALLGAIWGYNSEVNTHTLETHIYRLRQKIEADAANATLLVTAPGGYRLVR